MSDFLYPRPAILDDIPGQGHVILEASAGTGKTFILQNLVIDLLLGDPGYRLEELLVVTFTDKATWELRSRVRRQIEDMASGRVPPDRGDGTSWCIDAAARRKLEDALFSFDRAPIHTIHGFCNRLLREMAFEGGMRFALEPVEGKRAFHRAFRAELREWIAKEDEPLRLLDEWLGEAGVEGLEALLLGAHERRCLDTRRAPSEGEAALEARVIDAFLPRVSDRLDRMKREEGLIDFDDMLSWVARAIDGPGGEALVTALRGRFRCALIDEFQDTDDLQWKIFRSVFVDGGQGNRLFVIGDPKQAIYGFRGADVYTYRAACRKLSAGGAPTLHLDRNFRSTSRMIEACNRILDDKARERLLTGDFRYEHDVSCGKEQLKAVDAGGIEISPITILGYAPPEDHPKDEKLKAPGIRRAIGRQIALSLRGMLHDPALAITLGEGEKRRQVAGGGVFILTRTNEEAFEMGGYLREAGVRFAYYKQDGLFQTAEARSILDVLRAIESPGDPARRLKAWATPFFALRWRDLWNCLDLPDTHRMRESLERWREMADKRLFAAMFDRLVHDTGLVERELFLSSSERELTNYLHVFEVLLEEAVRRRLTLPDVIALLNDYIQEVAMPAGSDGNVQRLESEKDAVKIMTVYRSKGLEADVVFLFGGTGGASPEAALVDYHTEDGERKVAIGEQEKKIVRHRIDEEKAGEERRLLYVGITRAIAKLYVPYVSPDAGAYEMKGACRHLNARLAEIETQGFSSDLFLLETAREPAEEPGPTLHERKAIAAWDPPEDCLRAEPITDEFRRLRKRHPSLAIHSYTSLSSPRGARPPGLDPEDFTHGADAADAELAPDDLPGGRVMGRFLHEVIEDLPFGDREEWRDFAAWSRWKDVADSFKACMERHGIEDRWLDPLKRLVHGALTSPIALGESGVVSGIYRCRNARELDFLYPIPEEIQPLLSRGGEGRWIVERGYLKGYIDLVFEHAGRIYFADWKSDRLPAYGRPEMEKHVRDRYGLQASIYTLGVLRLLGIRDELAYAERFGGLLYLFLRGMTPEGDGVEGVYFHRPDWAETLEYERELLGSRVIPLEEYP